MLLTEDGAELQDEGWEQLALRQRYPRLRDIVASIGVRRTIEEAELAIQLESEFNQDPSILRDIDFASLASRLQQDHETSGEVLRRANVLTEDEVDDLHQRQRAAQASFALLHVQISCGALTSYFSGARQGGVVVSSCAPALQRQN